MYKIQKSLVDNKPSFMKSEDLSETKFETEETFDTEGNKEPGFFKRFINNAKIRLATPKTEDTIDIDESVVIEPNPEMKR